MLLPALDSATAFAMTALASWSLVALLWMVGRNFTRQGVAWIMGSTFSVGLGYLLVALSSSQGSDYTISSAYIFMGMGASLAALGLRRFLWYAWSLADTAILLMPFTLPVLWSFVAQGDLALRARLTNGGFLFGIMILGSIVWRGRKSSPGNGWRIMLAGLAIQWLSLVPFVFVDAAPVPSPGSIKSLGEQIIEWVLCIVMFQNVQVGVLSFLMMLQDRRNAEERLAAELDVLTQLPNRRSLDRRLAILLPVLHRARENLGVVLLDIDHFKGVNDRFGHEAGDRVLQHVAQILRQQLRQNEIVARYGGEEFIIVLPRADTTRATAIAARIVEKMANSPLEIDGRPQWVTISAGVHVQQLNAPDKPRADATIQWRDVVRQADAAMYEAKHAGRNRYAVYSARALPDAATTTP